MDDQDQLTTLHLTRLQQLRENTPFPESGGEDSAILRELASIERPLLQTLLQECSCSAGDILFREGDPGNAMYVILAGQVVVIKGSLDAPTVLGYRGPGEIIGEMALLENAPRSASVIAIENLRLLRINHEDFQVLLNNRPGIGRKIMAVLSARLRNTGNALDSSTQTGRQLTQRVSQLYTEKEHLLEMQRVRQETSDLIVHDLRNPLGVIYGVLDVLKMVLPEDVLNANQELLNIAEDARDRMKRLIDSMLDVARMEGGITTLNIKPTDLAQLLERVVRFSQLNAQRRQIHLHTTIPHPLPLIALDEAKIERVLANLMDNALKYTPQGREICISATLEASQVQVSVTDTGPGIPEAERQRIFERFAQVQGDHLARRRGFGLGLAFCKLAIEIHGGTIWIEPGPGEIGSRFIFTLPLNSAQSH
ncbi:MAG: HAMP domain-containing sensor histidine kinase [Anaerolineae bacterium]|jgi:signal transduction histidine kinase|nr:HAMP domain-containing sensor histidine kinase [Anaerolineae bacterium]